MTTGNQFEGRIAIEAGDYAGETPVWSTTEQALYWINCQRPARVRRWDPETHEIKNWDMPERIGGMALRSAGDPVVCLASGVFNLNMATGALSLLAPAPYSSNVKLHESCIDPSGRLWVGGIDHNFGPTNLWPGGAAVCRLDGKKLTPMIPGLSVTNSLAFSPDGRRMYFCDTLRRLIWQADMEPRTGAILGMREFVRLAETEISDGAAMDIDGGYWLAIFGAGEVRRYRPDGALDRTLTMPFSQPTKVAFGGPHLTTIYVTSTRIEFPGFPRSGMNGAIQEIDVGIKGMPEFFFAG